MNISSNYYDYYYLQNYQLNSIQNAKSSTDSSDSSKNETEAVGLQPRRRCSADGAGDIMNLSLSGRMMRDSLQMEDSGDSEISEGMEKLKTDLDSIKTSDIDSMSSEQVKEMLLTLQTDITSIQDTNGSTVSTQQKDISELSESEMREILKKIQQFEVNGPGKREEDLPMMIDFDPSQIMVSDLESQDTSVSTGTDSSSKNSKDYFQQLINDITASYEDSTGSSDEYINKLKESMNLLFNQQRSDMYEFTSIIPHKPDYGNVQQV